MAYRGEDLDLRTPQNWGAQGREQANEDQPNWWTRTTIYQGGRADPIWVDDTVMACCNHAFDLALAHRAPEVQLEHFINAMTLNSAAIQVLEAHGFAVPALRRESAAAIASETITTLTAGKPGPRRSEALEEALRLAADRAYPRRTPVTVEDMLLVMLETKRDTPAVQLLQRHVDTVRPRIEPLPHMHRYGADMRYDVIDDRPRYASQAAHDYFTRGAASFHHLPARLGREPAPASFDSMSAGRIDALERALSDLALDLADDRKALHSTLIELQRNSASQSEDASRFRNGLSDRLSKFEDVLQRRQQNASELVADPGIQHLAELQQKIDGRIGELERTFQLLLDRLTGLERRLLAEPDSIDLELIDGRLQEVEQSIAAKVEAIGAIAPVSARLDTIERALDNRAAETGRTVSFVGERLRSFEDSLGTGRSHTAERLVNLERSVAGYAERAVEAGATHERDLAELHEALVRLNANQQTLAGALEQWRLDTTGDLSVVNNRLKAIEESESRSEQRFTSASHLISAIHNAITKREVHKSRFRQWLFGTDEWYAASYDTDRWRARQSSGIPSGLDGGTSLPPRMTPPTPLRRSNG